jgi:hypothetical protein
MPCEGGMRGGFRTAGLKAGTEAEIPRLEKRRAFKLNHLGATVVRQGVRLATTRRPPTERIDFISCISLGLFRWYRRQTRRAGARVQWRSRFR